AAVRRGLQRGRRREAPRQGREGDLEPPAAWSRAAAERAPAFGRSRARGRGGRPMSDDRLLAALTRLSHEELPGATDRQIKARLETAWTSRMRAVSAPLFSVRRFAPVLAALVVTAGLGGAALGAGADSPL